MTVEPSAQPKAMEKPPEAALSQKGLSPLKALVLSALVLPGLGQILTGRKIRGAIMAGLLALWLPVAIIKVGLDLNKVMPELAARAADGEALSLAVLQELMLPMTDTLIWLFTPLLTIWFWSLADSIVYWLHDKKER